jgi:hypothetical protein
VTFPFPSGCPDEKLLERWETLLDKAPRLAPWLDQTLRGRRSILQGRGVLLEIEEILWRDLSRWLPDFEALPSFAVSAIATTLEEKREIAPPVLRPTEQRSVETSDRITELQTLAADPTFALAFHCVEARIRPLLTPLLPESAWFGLLHASAPSGPELNAGVAVALVLRLASGSWQERPSEQRRSALRAFLLSPADLRASPALLQKLCASLPFPLQPSQLPELVAASQKLRGAFNEASRLCSRIVARLTRRPGGLSLLLASSASSASSNDAEKASEDEVAELRASARRHSRMAGFDRLLRLTEEPAPPATGGARRA